MAGLGGGGDVSVQQVIHSMGDGTAMDLDLQEGGVSPDPNVFERAELGAKVIAYRIWADGDRV